MASAHSNMKRSSHVQEYITRGIVYIKYLEPNAQAAMPSIRNNQSNPETSSLPDSPIAFP